MMWAILQTADTVEDLGVEPGDLDLHDVQFMLCEAYKVCEKQT